MRTIEDVFNDLKAHGYNFAQHPEGGYYSETRRSEEIVKVKNKKNQMEEREAYTTIYYLLEGDDFSAFHRFDADETWNFVEGNPIILYMLNPYTKVLSKVKIGQLADNGIPMYTVPKGFWFAAEVAETNTDCTYSLATCNVAPAFRFEGFELGKRDSLLREFANGKSTENTEIIKRLTK